MMLSRSTGYIALLPEAGNYSAIKAFRVFRILRTITAIPELRVMIAALGKCIAAMTDVIILIVSAVRPVFCFLPFSGSSLFSLYSLLLLVFLSL